MVIEYYAKDNFAKFNKVRFEKVSIVMNNDRYLIVSKENDEEIIAVFPVNNTAIIYK